MMYEMLNLFEARSKFKKKTFKKILQGASIYASLFRFWNTYLKDRIQAAGDTLPDKSREMPKEWVDEYDIILQQFFQMNFIGWQRDFMEQVSRVYGLRLSRGKKEGLLKSIEAYNDHIKVLNEIATMFSRVGYNAIEQLINRIKRLKEKGNPPQTFSEFYDMWIEINEIKYLELFNEDCFAKKLGRLMDTSNICKQRFNSLITELLRETPILTAEELDNVYKKMYELKKEIKQQRKEIDEIENIVC